MDAHRRLLAFRLAGNGAAPRRYQAPHVALRAVALVPVHRHEQRAGRLILRQNGPRQHPAVTRLDTRQRIGLNAVARRVVGMQRNKRFGVVLHQARHQSGARHGVPLIANAAGIHRQRPSLAYSLTRPDGSHRQQTRLAVGMIKAARAEQTSAAGRVIGVHRPLDRRQPIPLFIAQLRQPADIEGAPAVIFKTGKRGMFTENRCRMTPGEGVAVAKPLRHLRQHPPVGPRLALRRQEAALAREAPLRVSDGAVLLAPRLRRQQDIGKFAGIGAAHHVGDNHQLAAPQRLRHGVTVGQRHRRIGAHDPDRLHLAAADGLKQIDRLQPRRGRHAIAAPETPQTIDIFRGEIHMRRQLVRQAAHLASAHGVGLAGQ